MDYQHFRDLQQRESDNARHRENRGRLAFVQTSVATTGQGFVEVEDVYNFGLTFVEKPAFTWGTEMDPEQIREILLLDPDESIPFGPQCTVYVTDYDTDEKGLYVGAWIAVAVTFPTEIPVDATVEITHTLQFSGVAVKVVPPDTEE